MSIEISNTPAQRNVSFLLVYFFFVQTSSKKKKIPLQILSCLPSKQQHSQIFATETQNNQPQVIHFTILLHSMK